MSKTIIATVIVLCGISKCTDMMKPKVGQKLEVISAPEGAAVKLDGVVKGSTPLTLVNLDVQEGQVQTVTYEMKGYKSVEKKLTWSKSDQVVSATLEKTSKERIITVKSKPDGATVYMDGSPKGETPVTWSVDFEDGTEVNILVQRKGYSDITEKVKFGDEATKTLDYEFVKAGALKLSDLDRVLYKMQSKWRVACNTNYQDICQFSYSVNEEGKVTGVSSVNCNMPDINACTKKMIKRMKFPAAEKGRSDKFTWYGG